MPCYEYRRKGVVARIPTKNRHIRAKHVLRVETIRNKNLFRFERLDVERHTLLYVDKPRF